MGEASVSCGLIVASQQLVDPDSAHACESCYLALRDAGLDRIRNELRDGGELFAVGLAGGASSSAMRL